MKIHTTYNRFSKLQIDHLKSTSSKRLVVLYKNVDKIMLVSKNIAKTRDQVITLWSDQVILEQRFLQAKDQGEFLHQTHIPQSRVLDLHITNTRENDIPNIDEKMPPLE